MTKNKIKILFPWTWEYIIKNLLPEKKLKAAGISLVHPDEIFVKHPDWNNHYGSNYGRSVTVKDGKIKLKGNETKKDPSKYREYCFTQPGKKDKTISAHRLIADCFLPNFWEGIDRNQLQAHHLDHSKTNNVWTNIMLLPIALHYVMNRTKKTALFSNGKFREMNLYQIMAETGLNLDEMILATKNKPEKSIGGKWSVFEVRGHYIGFQFVPEKKGKKKKTK